MRSRVRPSADDGATLILVLIIVTVISVVMGVLLSQADTSVRTTVVLRDQASDAYAADAAGQAIIKQLQNGKFDCSTTATSNASLGTSGAPFYTPASTVDGSLNAYVECTPDTINGKTTTGSGVTIDENNTLGYALLTVGTTVGQSTVLRGNNPTCIAGGSVVSNADINLAGQGSTNSLKAGKSTSTTNCTLVTDPNIAVTSASTNGCDGAQTDSNPSHFTPTPCTHAAGPVPASTWTTLADQPTSGYTVSDPAPLCRTSGTTTYAAFRPGRYTVNPTTVATNNGCNPSFEWFTPGTYYFTYSGQWSWPATVVGGTPQDGTGSVISSLVGFDVTDTSNANAAKLDALANVTKFPGSCADPALQNTYDGVEFVFGGSSTIKPNESGHNELCATYRADGIPVALYGVSYDVVGGNTMSVTNGSAIPVETLCSATPCRSTSTGGSSLIASDSAGKNSIYIQGYLYAPSAPVTMIDKNQAAMLLGWGVVVRSFDFTENGASPITPFVAYRPVLHQGQQTSYTIKYLSVWTCVSSASVCRSGQPDLRAKVQIDDTTGQATVLSWSHAN